MSNFFQGWTKADIDRHNAKVNENHRSPSRPVPEQVVRHEPLAAEEGKESHAGRISVRIISHRRRLTDPDNLCGKYFLDCCRYAGLLRDDTAAEIDYGITQKKVKTKAEEKTEILIGE